MNARRKSRRRKACPRQRERQQCAEIHPGKDETSGTFDVRTNDGMRADDARRARALGCRIIALQRWPFRQINSNLICCLEGRAFLPCCRAAGKLSSGARCASQYWGMTQIYMQDHAIPGNLGMLVSPGQDIHPTTDKARHALRLFTSCRPRAPPPMPCHCSCERGSVHSSHANAGLFNEEDPGYAHPEFPRVPPMEPPVLATSSSPSSASPYSSGCSGSMGGPAPPPGPGIPI